VNSYRPKYDFGTARPGPFFVFDPIGMRVIDSTPPATAMSTTPAPIRLAARFVACCDDPHCVSTVVLATDNGRPAVNQAVRPTLNDCSPTCDTHPVTTCPTVTGSTPVRSIKPLNAVANRSAG
jgi:hypothetical protein